MGDRQKDWRPEEVNCPLDGQQETISHSLFHCTLLNSIFNKIDSSFAPAAGMSLSVKDMMQHRPTKALSTPHGLLGWAATMANWKVRCTYK